MLPKVSIIIPTYKRALTLDRAIESVLNQTYDNIEIFIIDDNNPDTIEREQTKEVMEKYSDNSKVIYLKHDRNKNGSAARNTGIKHSTGKYITFLDDDDEMFPEKLKSQVEKMEELDETWGACYTSYVKEMADGSFQRGTENREGNLIVEALMRTLYIYAGSNLMVRRNIVEEINGFDESFMRNQDLEFLVRILKNYKIAYVDTCGLLMHYDLRITSLSYERCMEIDNIFIEKFKPWIDELNSNEQYKVYCVIGLEKIKTAIICKKTQEIYKICRKYKLNILCVFKYLIYLFKRKCTNTCYGFRL